jgi:hypothetical protein
LPTGPGPRGSETFAQWLTTSALAVKPRKQP